MMLVLTLVLAGACAQAESMKYKIFAKDTETGKSVQSGYRYSNQGPFEFAGKEYSFAKWGHGGFHAFFVVDASDPYKKIFSRSFYWKKGEQRWEIYVDRPGLHFTVSCDPYDY